ncbi:hypothetical protein BH11ACT2_BH11ACT2_00590 [soil metagenome]
MATRHSRSLPAILLMVAGALTFIGAIVSGIPTSVSGAFLVIYLLADLALAVALLLLAGSFSHRFGRLWLYLSAAGWAVYGLSNAAGIIPLFTYLGGYVAIVFGVIAGVVVYRQRLFTPRAATMFLVSMILGAVYLFVAVLFLPLAFGIALVVTGVFMRRRL